MSVADVLKAFQTNLGTIGAIVTGIGTLAGAAIKLRTYFTRSRLLVPNAFPLPEVPGEQAIFAKEIPDLQTMMVGRTREIRELMRAVQNYRLTFLYGESGSGKSTLLKLGLARELAQSGTWIPIYLDAWGQDWVHGPQESLADATDAALRALGLSADQPVSSETVFPRLAELRSMTGRRPILLFDQLDDYQNAHRDCFRATGTGLFLSPSELCDANPFWRDLRDLVLTKGEPIHVLLATRDDAESGLHCFRFGEPRVYPLARLDAADAEQLIHTLAPESVVKKPEYGFREMMSRVLADLGRDHGGKILPMQLRVALAGIGRMAGPLTPARFERLGGVAGLGAQYVENAIQDTPGAWPVVNAMAQRTAEGRGKAALLTRKQILALVPPGQDASRLLQELIDARILRRRLADSEHETWQLYHDYLADAIVALDRRKRKWSLLLSEAQERFRLAGGLFQKWSRLLSPSALIRLFWQRLRDADFRFGEHLGYVRLSLPRMVLNVWVLAAVAAYGGWVYWSEEREAKEIAGAFLQGADQGKEFRALWRLSAAGSGRTRKIAFEQLLSTPVGARRLGANIEPAIAALGLRISSLDGLRGLAVGGLCTESSGRDACVALTLIAGDGDLLADRILERMDRTADADGLSRLGQALAALANEARGDQPARGADRILERMQATTDALDLSQLGKTLAALAKGAHGDQAVRGADRILERMQGATDGRDLDPSHLGEALVALAKEAHGEQAVLLAGRILERIQNATGAGELSYLRMALVALAVEAHGQQAAHLADRVLERMEGSTDAFDLSNMGMTLGALAAEAHGDQAARGADRILKRMKDRNNAYELSALGTALAALANEDQAAHGADRIVEWMQVPTPANEVLSLGKALAALAKGAHGDQAARVADRIVERMQVTTDAVDLSYLGKMLAALAKEAHGDQAARGAGRILQWMDNTTRAYDLSSLGEALAALAKEAHGGQAAQGADRILDGMIGPTDQGQLSRLGEALAALAKEVPGEQAARLADRILERVQRTTDARELSRLGLALAALAERVEGPKRIQLLIKLTAFPLTVDCGLAVSQAPDEELPLLVDMLKWPTCGGSRYGVMLRIAELKGQDAKLFDASYEPDQRSSFHADLRKFIAWLKTQEGPDRKHFDVEGPPIHNPYYPARGSGGSAASASRPAP